MSTVKLTIPRVNFLGILSAVLAVISITVPWWGVSSYPFGFSFTWGLFTTPAGTGSDFFGTDNFSRALAQVSPLFIGLVLIITALTIVGSLAEKGEVLLYGSFGLSVLVAVLYAYVIGASIQAACQGSSSCVSGPIGSANGISWGFQTGFYLVVAAGVVSLVAGILHRVFITQNTSNQTIAVASGQKTKYCFNCGSALPSAPAKYCPNCANALTGG